MRKRGQRNRQRRISGSNHSLSLLRVGASAGIASLLRSPSIWLRRSSRRMRTSKSSRTKLKSWEWSLTSESRVGTLFVRQIHRRSRQSSGSSTLKKKTFWTVAFKRGVMMTLMAKRMRRKLMRMMSTQRMRCQTTALNLASKVIPSKGIKASL